MARKKYDIAVIGAGLNGLVISHALAKSGKKIALIESQEKLGGIFQDSTTRLGSLPDFFSHLSFNKELEENFSRWTSKIFEEQEQSYLKPELVTKTFDSGKFKDFVGFGDKSPDFVDEITEYTNSTKLQMQTGFTEIVKSYISDLEQSENVDILFNSTLTGFHLEEGRLDLIEVNDGKKIEADEYIYTANLFTLNELDEIEILSKAQRQSLAKASSFTAIHLQFIHPGSELPIDKDYILAAAKDKSQACYGQFSLATNFANAQAEAYQISTWMSFVESSLTNDMELTGNLVREMKRQVKRAFPEAIESSEFERVFVAPNSHCTNKVKVKDFKSDKYPNFYILSRELDEVQGVMGRIHTAVQLLDELDIALAKFQSPEIVDTVENSVDNLEASAQTDVV